MPGLFSKLRNKLIGKDSVSEEDLKRKIRRTTGDESDPYTRQGKGGEAKYADILDKAQSGGLYGYDKSSADVEEANKALQEILKRKRR